MVHEDMKTAEMEEGETKWKHITTERKKALMKAKMDFKIRKVRAKLDFLKKLQKIFG